MAKGAKSLYKDEPKYPNQRVKIVLPFPPSQNHMYFTAKNGSRILKDTAKKYFANAQKICIKAIKKQGWKEDLDSVWYYADMVFYMPDKRKRDTHNTLKITLDAMEKIVYPNDYYVLPRIQDVHLDVKNPRVIITIYPKI